MTDEAMRLLDLVGLHVEATSGTPLVILREHDAPHRVLPIFIGSAEAASIAVALSGQSPPRPLAHDLMVGLLEGLNGTVSAVEVTEIRDGTFFAELAMSGPDGERRLDARPSDSIALAVRLGVPLYASSEVLSQAGSTLADRPDEEAIDRAVAEFRGYLDRMDPAALTTALEESPGPPPAEEPTGHNDALPETDPGAGEPG